jgi:hypothetical protein
VPYALYAENSGNSTPPTPNLEAVLAENNTANNQQIKDLQDPTDDQDAVTKSYADVLFNSQGLMNFNDWTNYQILSDYDTMEVESNSFVFVNAYSPTIILPSDPAEFDVVYVYTTHSYNGFESLGLIFFGANGHPIALEDYNQIDIISESNNYVAGGFRETGLQTLLFAGGQWFIPNIYYAGQTDVLGDLDGDGFTEQDGDCNPDNPNTYPGATEICDYQDGFGNMFYDPIIQTCNPGIGGEESYYTLNNLDCDDQNEDVNPDAVEIEDDGIDNDCDGQID